MKQFTYAGVSRLNGELKLRFATDEGRFLVLVKNGHTEVEMIKLTQPLDKDGAIKELLSRNFDNGRSEITDLLVGKAKGATVKKNTVVVKVPPTAMKKLVGANIEVSEKMTAKEARKIRDAWNKAHAHLSYDGE
jgi:hypothetical protein